LLSPLLPLSGRWARDTLEQHAGDPRPAALPYARLDGGDTGDAFWDAAQRQLAVNGELHNNVRMTWGKAFLAWAPSPQAALRWAAS
jgi:deoxyribodipyrimidine photolyase